MHASPHLISGSWEVRRTPPVRYLASMFGNRLWRKRWPTCGATVRFYRLGDDCLRPSKAEALFVGACLARDASVASGPCHDRPNHVARFAAQRHIGNFGMISQIAAKPELSKAAYLGSYWFCSGSIRFEAVDNRVFRIIWLTTGSSGLSANARMTGVAC